MSPLRRRAIIGIALVVILILWLLGLVGGVVPLSGGHPLPPPRPTVSTQPGAYSWDPVIR